MSREKNLHSVWSQWSAFSTALARQGWADDELSDLKKEASTQLEKPTPALVFAWLAFVKTTLDRDRVFMEKVHALLPAARKAAKKKAKKKPREPRQLSFKV